MKKFLLILGSVFLALIVIVVGMVGYAAVQGQGLDAESKTYLEDTLPKILSDLTTENVMPYMDEDVVKRLNPDTMTKVFSAYRKLGAFKNYGDVKGSSNIFVNQNGKFVTAVYTVKTEFANGPADIKFQLIKKNNQWKIAGLYINSLVLLEGSPAPVVPTPVAPATSPSPAQEGAP